MSNKIKKQHIKKLIRESIRKNIELILESDDGNKWKEFKDKYKPPKKRTHAHRRRKAEEKHGVVPTAIGCYPRTIVNKFHSITKTILNSNFGDLIERWDIRDEDMPWYDENNYRQLGYGMPEQENTRYATLKLTKDNFSYLDNSTRSCNAGMGRREYNHPDGPYTEKGNPIIVKSITTIKRTMYGQQENTTISLSELVNLFPPESHLRLLVELSGIIHETIINDSRLSNMKTSNGSPGILVDVLKEGQNNHDPSIGDVYIEIYLDHDFVKPPLTANMKKQLVKDQDDIYNKQLQQCLDKGTKSRQDCHNTETTRGSKDYFMTDEDAGKVKGYPGKNRLDNLPYLDDE